MREAQGPEYHLQDWQKKLIALYESCIANGTQQIEIDEKALGIEGLIVTENDLPVSFYSLIQIFNDKDSKDFVIDYIGSDGPSALNLLSRFGHLDQKITEQLNECAFKESEVIDPDIVAEIVHVPNSRLGNVLSRPTFRKFEIPIN